jgi:hypothetical protein
MGRKQKPMQSSVLFKTEQEQHRSEVTKDMIGLDVGIASSFT